MRRPFPASRRAGAWGALVVIGLCASTASAQPKTPPAKPRPVVDDPMLAPLPAPRTVLATWDEARRLLASRSTDLRRADASVAGADARVRQARAALRPDARFSGAVTLDLLHPRTAPGIPAGDDYEPTSPLGTAQISITQALIDVGAWRARDAAVADRRGAQASRDDTDRRALQDLARALINVAAAERAAELNRVGLRQALERQILSRRTFELGAATELDVVRVQQDVALARAALIAGDEDVRVAREELGVALGLETEVGITPDLAGGGLVAAVKNRCRPLRDGEARADVVAAEAAVDAARKRKAQARGGYFPTLDLNTTANAFTTDPPPGRVPAWTISALVTIPIWEGGLRAGLVAERTAAEADARAVAEDVRRTVRVEVARARRGGEVASALVAAATESPTLAERVDTMTRRSFEIGRATSLELVQSAAVLRQAELTLAIRQFTLVANQVAELLTEARCER